MATTNQQSQNAQILTDQYYDQTLSSTLEKSFTDISHYDSSVDYLSDTWAMNKSIDMKAQLEEYMEGDVEFIGEFAQYISQNMVNLESQLPEIYNSKNLDALRKLNHMVKPTIEMVGDHDLLDELMITQSEWEDGRFHESRILRIGSRARVIHNRLQSVIEHSKEAA